MEERYQKLEAELAELTAMLDENNRQMEEFKNKLEDLQTKIERGEKLVGSLSDEKERWNLSLSDLRDQDNDLTGNSILSAAFMSLNGPFPAEYREKLINCWLQRIKELGVPHTAGFMFSDFLSTPAQQRSW